MRSFPKDEADSATSSGYRAAWHSRRWMNGTMANIGFLLDMDGVIYRGSELIPGAYDFVTRLRNLRIPFRYLTNNSQRARRDVALKLRRLGIDAHEDDVFTCAMATARFMAIQKPGGTAYVIGEHGLAAALHRNGYTVVDDDADFVVVGEGRTLTYEMIERGVRLVEKGARLIATNLDPSCPTENGIRPGCGAIVAMIEKATGVQAFSVGKPSPVMMRAARKEMNLRTDETVMVGDTMETDILGAVQMGYRSVLVLTGGTRREDLAKFAYQPDLVVEHIGMIPDEFIFGRALACA
jgi:NagD protein